jgi:hypothetical protein
VGPEEDKSQRDFLGEELEAILSGELAEDAARAEPDTERLVERTFDCEAEFFEATAGSWSSLEKARIEAHELARSRSWPRYLLKPRFWLAPLVAAGLFLVGLVLSGLLVDLVSESFGGMTAIVVVVPSIAGGVVAYRRIRRSEVPDVRLLNDRLRAAEEQHRKALRGIVRAWLTEQINAALESSYGTVLTYSGRRGLAEIDDSTREVPTGVRERLLRLMTLMPGGAIGLSGSRGAGKTTLMRSLCRSAKGDESQREVLAAIVDAPVSYDAREFVLHLFSRVCCEVLGPDRVAELRGWGRGARPGANPLARILTRPLTLAGLVSAVVGYGVVMVEVLDLGVGMSRVAWGGVLMLGGFVVLQAELIGERQRRSRMPGATPLSLASGDPEDRDIEIAAMRLRQIWFQQSFTSGWSGGLKTPIGIEGGVSGSTELAEQQLSFPEIVSMFKDFLGQIASSRQVRLGIDELDKMEDETARRFLNEIKVIFRVPGCFFFVSISEDAMSFFERRGGLPFRDVFDSSFDDVAHVPQLRFQVSRELLDRRIVDLPLPFACLLHCLSGGLPRDLIRAARDLVEMERGTALELATAEMMRDALRSKATAARVAARRFQLEDHSTLLTVWLDRFEAMDVKPDVLLAACHDFKGAFLDRLSQLPNEADLRGERRELQALGTQLIAYAYYAATICEFFARFDDSDYVDDAIRPAQTGDAASAPVDRLADVSRAFSANVSRAWAMLSRLREGPLGKLDTVPFPELHLGDPDGRPAAATVDGLTA